MAEHLLNEGYKDASAVIIGAVLEDSLSTQFLGKDRDTEAIRNLILLSTRRRDTN